jgi:hypothetical protein
VAPQVGAHEPALRDDLEAAGADIGERVVNQSAAVSLALEWRINLGVNQNDRLGERAVVDDADSVVARPELIAMLGFVVDEA